MVDRGEYNAAGDLTVGFKNTLHGVLRAWICGAGGYVETYVDNPGELYDAYEKSASGTGGRTYMAHSLPGQSYLT